MTTTQLGTTPPVTSELPWRRAAALAPIRPSAPPRACGRIVGSILLIAFALALLVPFFWMVISSLKGPNEVFSVPVRWLPETLAFGALRRAVDGHGDGRPGCATRSSCRRS